MLPQRKRLNHTVPDWVQGNPVWFITICCQERERDSLCQEKTAHLLLQSAKFYHDHHKWWLHLLVRMPDHLYALIPDFALAHAKSVLREPGAHDCAVNPADKIYEPKRCENFIGECGFAHPFPAEKRDEADFGIGGYRKIWADHGGLEN
jgi:hypothetical protein